MKINQTFFENIAICAFFILVAMLCLLAFYKIFVMVPSSIYTQSKCFEKGYLNYKTTLSLDKYCIDKDGNVIKI